MTTRRLWRGWRLLVPTMLLIVLLGMLSGCFYFGGSPLDGRKDFRKTADGTFGIGGFKPHKTTRSQVEAALGPPQGVSQDGWTVLYEMTTNGYAVMPLCFFVERRPAHYAMAIRYARDRSIDRYKIENDESDVVTILYSPYRSMGVPWSKLRKDGFDLPAWPLTTRPVSRPASRPASAAAAGKSEVQ